MLEKQLIKTIEVPIHLVDEDKMPKLIAGDTIKVHFYRGGFIEVIRDYSFEFDDIPGFADEEDAIAVLMMQSAKNHSEAPRSERKVMDLFVIDREHVRTISYSWDHLEKCYYLEMVTGVLIYIYVKELEALKNLHDELVYWWLKNPDYNNLV